jgi:hypothetical protein
MSFVFSTGDPYWWWTTTTTPVSLPLADDTRIAALEQKVAAQSDKIDKLLDLVQRMKEPPNVFP